SARELLLEARMSRQIPPKTLIKILKAEGLKVKKVRGWKSRCRCHAGAHYRGGRHIRGWEPLHGTMVHITAGGLGGRSPRKYIRDIINGDPNIPNKAQFVTAPDGTVYVNSCGRANHAGRVSAAGLRRV